MCRKVIYEQEVNLLNVLVRLVCTNPYYKVGSRFIGQSDLPARVASLESTPGTQQAKALAESAALLILRKKAQAIWGGKEED